MMQKDLQGFNPRYYSFYIQTYSASSDLALSSINMALVNGLFILNVGNLDIWNVLCRNFSRRQRECRLQP